MAGHANFCLVPQKSLSGVNLGECGELPAFGQGLADSSMLVVSAYH